MQLIHSMSSLFLACLLSVGLVGCSEEKASQAAPQMPPTEVRVVTLQKRDVPLTARYMGQTMGYLSVEVRAQVVGILKRRAYREGSYVKQGQLLFEIDPATALASLEQANGRLAMAKAQMESARRELDRILPLYQRNAVSQRDRDTAQSAYDSAKADVESAQGSVNTAKIQLQYTNVLAPISGYTSRATRNEGDLITLDAQGSLLTTINQTDPMYVTFAIPSSEIQRMRRLSSQGRAKIAYENAQVVMNLLDEGQYATKGVVTFVDTQIDPKTSVIRARAEFENSAGILLPGQFATVAIEGTTLLNAIMIPQRAVLQTADGPMVYVVGTDNKVSMKPVTLGDTYGSTFLLESGLVEGERLMVDGIGKVRPGMEVKALEDQSGVPVKNLVTPDSVAPLPDNSAIDTPAPVLPADDQPQAQAQEEQPAAAQPTEAQPVATPAE